MKTARLHLMKFLFALPLLVFILLAFRTEQAVTIKQALPSFKDTVPGVSQRNASAIARPAIAPAPVTINSPSVNNMGYILSVADDNGECVVIIKDKNRKIIRAMTLEDWNKNKSQNEKQYGKIPPPPRPPVPPLAPRPPLPPAAPVIVTENENTITVDGEIVTVENDEENDVEAADNDKEDVEEAEVEEPDPAALR